MQKVTGSKCSKISLRFKSVHLRVYLNGPKKLKRMYNTYVTVI